MFQMPSLFLSGFFFSKFFWLFACGSNNLTCSFSCNGYKAYVVLRLPLSDRPHSSRGRSTRQFQYLISSRFLSSKLSRQLQKWEAHLCLRPPCSSSCFSGTNWGRIDWLTFCFLVILVQSNSWPCSNPPPTLSVQIPAHCQWPYQRVLFHSIVRMEFI